MSDADVPPGIKRVYLDVCSLCRPFDDQQQIRIHLETSAVELILAHIRQAELELIVSPTHELEIKAITDLEEREQLLLLLRQLGAPFAFDLPKVRQSAEQRVSRGLGVAEAAQADFVTVDDRMLKQCRRFDPAVWCGSPPAYCEKENLR